MKTGEVKIEKSWAKTMVFILILVFYASFLVHKIALPVYDDLPRQIKIGEEIVQGHFDILYKNTFSYTEPEQTFYNHHWLSGIIFYVFFGILGWSGLVVFKVIVLLLAFSIIFFTALKKADFWLVSIFSIPTILILVQRTGLRPEIFSYLFIAVYLYLLFSFEKNPDSKKIYWLIPLQLIWVNTHIFFSIGIMLVIGFLFEKIVHNYKEIFSNFRETFKKNVLLRKLFIVLLSVILVSFINPRGIEGVFYHYPLNFPALISENQSLSQFQKGTFLWSNLPIVVFKLSVTISIIIFISYFWRKRRSINFTGQLPIFYFLALTTTSFLGYMIVRGISLFALVFLVVVTVMLNESFLKIKNRFRPRYPRLKNIFVIIFVFIILCFMFPQNRIKISPYNKFGLGLTDHSEDSIFFFKENKLKGPIFNDPDVGSYLIYHLYPQEKVFTDNRFADAYSANFFKNVYLMALKNEDVWSEISKKYDFNTIFFYQYSGDPQIRGFLWRRVRDPVWSLVYVDRYNVIFVRNVPENIHIINKFKITSDNVAERLSHLSNSPDFEDQAVTVDTFHLFGRKDLGMNALLNILIKWPHKTDEILPKTSKLTPSE